MKRKLYIFLIFLGILVTEGCTDLNEEVLDESSATGLTDKQLADGFIAPTYGSMLNIFTHTNYFALQEISTDEAILPFRGGKDWGDNGIYLSLHQHATNSQDVNVNNIWNTLNQGISRTVTALNGLPALTDPSRDLYIAEARAMRAFYSMIEFDLFNLVFVKNETISTSTVLRNMEAFQFIESELLAVEPVLEDVATVGPGRLSKQAAWGLLARLYLNAAVYRDRYATAISFNTEDMDKVISYCDKLINSGKFALSNDYFALFSDENHTNKELIFAVDQRADLPGSHNRLAYFSISGDMFPIPTSPSANGTDGPAITPDFYRTWTDAFGPDPAGVDPRFYQKNLDPNVECVSAANYRVDRGILRGQQYGVYKEAGAFVKCPNGDFKIGKLYNWTRTGGATLPVDFKEQVDFTAEGRNYDRGYRVLKYEFAKKTINGRDIGDADIVLIRLADVYLMRAEAKLRKNAGDATALADVNAVRAARTMSRGTAVTPAPPLAAINLDLLFRERGFELYWEMVRRTDMIRFGKYEGTWTEKKDSNPQKRVFPIPSVFVDAASAIPGYITQNPGY